MHTTPSSRYTWFTLDTLEEGWQKVQKLVKEREMALLKEAKRQERNDELRKTFAQHANTFHSWLTDVRYGSLDDVHRVCMMPFFDIWLYYPAHFTKQF